jgi:hypothetical protein
MSRREEEKKIDWRASEAKEIIKNDLRKGLLALHAEDCPPKDAWEIYRHRTEFAKVPYTQFRDNLRGHRTQEQEAREGKSSQEKKRKPKSSKPKAKKEKKIDWKTSKAREIIKEDLQKGELFVDEKECSAEQAWTKYRQYEAFRKVPFCQFSDNLKGHRMQELKARKAKHFEEAAMKNDRKLYPRQERNHRGELVFDISSAKPLLRKDVKAGRHISMVSVDQLWLSRHEYQAFRLGVFRRRVRQEVRRWKMLNFLEMKRDLKAAEKAEKREKLAVKEANMAAEIEEAIKKAEQEWTEAPDKQNQQQSKRQRQHK